MSVNVSILGTPYEIQYKTEQNDSKLNSECDGYMDYTTKIIVVDSTNHKETDTVSDLSEYRNQVLRHEIIHAFLYESGLYANSSNGWAVDEEIVDWIAIQFPKIQSVFECLKCEK